MPMDHHGDDHDPHAFIYGAIFFGVLIAIGLLLGYFLHHPH